MARAKTKNAGVAITGEIHHGRIMFAEIREALYDFECATWYSPDDHRERHVIKKGELCRREIRDGGTFFYCRCCRPFILMSELL